MKVALITGVTGQDGAYLSELLLVKGYVVHGIKRRSSSFNTSRIDHLLKEKQDQDSNFFLHYGDMTEGFNLLKLIKEIEPDEIYNLAAMSHVHVSFMLPEYVAQVDGVGALRLLEAVRICGLDKKIKIYQASTSELFGNSSEKPLSEKTPFHPCSPYAVAKLYAYWIVVNYRESYNMFACNGILFNHESPLRGETFVTRKISMGVAKIAKGLIQKLFLGNLDSKRDFGHAKEYVEAMWLILQQDTPEDWVIATGKSTTIREVVILAFSYIGVEIEFHGAGIDEKGYVKNCSDPRYQLEINKVVIEIDPTYFRPSEVNHLVGDMSKARKKLGWVPKFTIEKIIKEMVSNDIHLLDVKKNV